MDESNSGHTILKFASDYKYLDGVFPTVTTAQFTGTTRTHYTLHFFKRALIPHEVDGSPDMRAVNLAVASIDFTKKGLEYLIEALQDVLDDEFLDEDETGDKPPNAT